MSEQLGGKEMSESDDPIKSPVIQDKTTGLYLYGDLYVADEFMREKGGEG